MMKITLETWLLISAGFCSASSFQYSLPPERIAKNIQLHSFSEEKKVRTKRYNDNEFSGSRRKLNTVCFSTLERTEGAHVREAVEAANTIYLQPRSTTSLGQGRTSKGLHLSYKSAIQVLEQYYKIHGNLVIPRRYTVPPTSDFPSEWHHLHLSTAVYNMKWWSKHVQSKPERVYELNQLGFLWDRLQPGYNLVLEALVTYKALRGHVQVPATFVVPYETKEEREQWPQATWGIPLGNCVQRIRSRGDFLRNEDTAWKRRRQLDNLEFVWDVREMAFSKFLNALKVYGLLQKKPGSASRALQVKSTFIIPSGEWLDERGKNDGISARRIGKHHEDNSKIRNPWPQELWDYPLGAKCTAVRQKGLYIKNNFHRQKALQEIGFQPSGNATLRWLEVVHAAAIYSRMHGRVLDVPSNFVVPAPPKSMSEAYMLIMHAGAEDAWPWPESLWGLNLGQRLKDVRLKGAYLKNKDTASSRKAQLDALGFVWQPKRGRRKRSLGGDPLGASSLFQN